MKTHRNSNTENLEQNRLLVFKGVKEIEEMIFIVFNQTLFH